jgi:hypothetical protein
MNHLALVVAEGRPSQWPLTLHLLVGFKPHRLEEHRCFRYEPSMAITSRSASCRDQRNYEDSPRRQGCVRSVTDPGSLLSLYAHTCNPLCLQITQLLDFFSGLNLMARYRSTPLIGNYKLQVYIKVSYFWCEGYDSRCVAGITLAASIKSTNSSSFGTSNEDSIYLNLTTDESSSTYVVQFHARDKHGFTTSCCRQPCTNIMQFMIYPSRKEDDST